MDDRTRPEGRKTGNVEVKATYRWSEKNKYDGPDGGGRSGVHAARERGRQDPPPVPRREEVTAARRDALA